MRVAVYAGTFDPVTRGHVSVIEAAVSVFDRVVVLVAVNAEKVPLFETAERLAMLHDATAHLTSVESAETEGWVVDYARAHGARFLVRGVRGATDTDYETTLANVNRALAPEITTVFIPAHAELSQVSSTRLKELARAGEDVSQFCPPGVKERLHEKLRGGTPSQGQEALHVGF